MLKFTERWEHIFTTLKTAQRVPAASTQPTPQEVAACMDQAFMQPHLEEHTARMGALLDQTEARNIDFDTSLLLEATRSFNIKSIYKIVLGKRARTADQVEPEMYLISLHAAHLHWEAWEALPEHDRAKTPLKHPIAPLIEGYCNPPLKPDTRDTAIVPNSARVAHVEILPPENGESTLFPLDEWKPTPAQLGITEQNQAFLPDSSRIRTSSSDRFRSTCTTAPAA